MNTLNLRQGGLGMPNRDYYLSDEFKPQREAYRAYLERTLRSIGTADPSAAAVRIMAFEPEIAKKKWPAEDRRDVEKTNNPMSSAELERYAPGFAWSSFFAGANIAPQKRLNLNENTAIRDLAAIYADDALANA